MFKWLKYIAVGITLVSLGGCFVPYGGGYYGGRGGRGEDDSYQALVVPAHTTSVDWQSGYRGYGGPSYGYIPERRYYNRRQYYQQRRDERYREEHRRRGDDGGD